MVAKSVFRRQSVFFGVVASESLVEVPYGTHKNATVDGPCEIDACVKVGVQVLREFLNPVIKNVFLDIDPLV